MRVVVAGVVALALSGQVARAGELAVVESYAGERPEGAADLLAPLYDELAAQGAPAVDKLVALVHERVSRPSRAPEGGGVSAAAALIEEGYDGHWLSGEFEQAIVTLGRAVELLDADPAAFADDSTLRDLRLRALVGIALSNKRLGNADAAARAMSQVIRSFPDRDFNRSLFGPEAHDLNREVAADLERLPKGKLVIDVDDEAAVVFINDRFAGTGAVETELLPGRYRVFVRKGSRDGRLHTVDVHSGETSRLGVAWRLDQALRTSGGAVVLSFDDEAARERDETSLAVRLARPSGSGAVVVIGIREHDGHRAVVGTMLSLDSARTSRSATLALEPVQPGPDKLRALARYLALGETSDAIVVTTPPEAGPTSGGGRPFRTWKWIALGTGVAAVAGGAVLVHIDGPILDSEGNHTPDEYDTASGGYVLAGAGLALITTGIVLWLKDDPSPERDAALVTAVPVPGGAVVGIGGTF